MNLGEIKDAVRDGLGHSDVLPRQLTSYIDRGRREIENRIDGHWMRDSLTWSTVVDQQVYPILTAPGGGLNLPNFKDIRSSRSKQSTEVSWSLPHLILEDFDEVWSHYNTDDDGEPCLIVIDGDNLSVFPPKPDKTYNMLLYYWKWTANPVSNLSTDFLMTRFPESLIFAACAVGLQIKTKSIELAAPWAGMMEAELRKIETYSKGRGSPEEEYLAAWSGPGQSLRTRYLPYGRP
jgi:hypothetical protein